MSTNSNNAARQKLIGEHMKTAAGRNVIAKSMTQPLRNRRDYASVVRKTFLVEDLPQGALPIYDKDPDVAAYVVGAEGQSIVSMAKSRRVTIPLFEIATLPEITISEIAERRFDAVDRIQELGKASIQAAEDDRGFSVMDAVATAGFDSLAAQLNADIPVVAPISGAVLADAFALIERHDLRVSRVYINARDYADLRKFGRDFFGEEGQKEIVDAGIRSVIFGAQVVTSRLVPAGTIYLCAEPEFFGRIPVRFELTVLSADDPRRRVIGFSMFENLGIGCHNPRGLARITITR